MYLQEEKKEIYGAETLYREVAYFQKVRTQYVKSLQPFNKAVELTPKDLRTLTGRSWSRAKCAYYKCALEDVNKAVALYPEDLRPMQLKALYTFLDTDFENAMVQNYRGIPKRKKPDLFIMGAMHCAEAIEKCIGKRGGHALRDHYDIIRTIAWKKAIDFRKGYQPKPRFKKRRRKQKKTDNTPELYTKFLKNATRNNADNVAAKVSLLSIIESLTDTRVNDLNITPKKKSKHQPPQRRTSNIEKFMAEKYLDKMCLDKAYLRHLKTDHRVVCPNKAGSDEIVKLARKGYKSLAFRQEILRVRHPFYSIKYSEVVPKGAFLQRQNNELKKVQDIARYDTELFIEQLQAAREAHLTNTCIHIANKAKTYIDKKPLKVLPNKEEYLKQVYDLIGLAHLDVCRLKETMDQAAALKRINFLFGLPISREQSQDSVIQENKKEFIDIEKAVYLTEKRMSKATTPLETVWLFYDLARYSAQLKKFDLSRFYARKALNMARVLEDNVWATNACFLIARTHVQQRNRNDAKNELMYTKEFAKDADVPEVVTYLTKCIKAVETIDFDEISTEKVIKQREKQIISSLMNIDLQRDAGLLFQRMSSIPGSRRMSIMPGVVMDEGDRVLSRKSSGKPSIKPLSKEELEFQASLTLKKGSEFS